MRAERLRLDDWHPQPDYIGEFMDNVKMNMVIAVPQLFYDLIARVFPGFLFLSMICFLSIVSIRDYGIQLAITWLKSPDNFWSSLYFGISYFIFSYYIGWILSILSNIKPFYEYSIDKILLRDYPPELKDYYHKIRLENESVGFRIVKLRAEAKMLESSRTAMCIVAFMMLLGFAYEILHEPTDYQQLLKQSSLVFVPAILAIIFQKSIKSAIERYTGNIEAHYRLMFGKVNSIYYSKY